jgi:GT2 family glycosyltransferase
MLSINILCWNTWKTLHDTLHVLKEELRGLDSEVIIVDNGSTDGCQDVATIKNETNLGISRGKNQGIDASRGEYILLLDGDIVPVPNSIRCLLEYMEAHKENDALGFFPDKFGLSKNAYGVQTWCEKLDPVIEHNNHCIYYGMYRRKVFDAVRMDEQFGPGYGYEDLDFYLQMKKAGIKQWVAGINSLAGKYYHNINSSIKVMGYRECRESQEERSKLFDAKWGAVYVG